MCLKDPVIGYVLICISTFFKISNKIDLTTIYSNRAEKRHIKLEAIINKLSFTQKLRNENIYTEVI